MSRDFAIQQIADAQADALARVRRVKAMRRAAEHRRRMQQVKEPAPAAWLAAVANDDQRDDRCDERELVTEEQYID